MAGDKFKKVKELLMKDLETIADVKATPAEYLSALKDIRGNVEDWLDASIDAARDDLARAGEGD